MKREAASNPQGDSSARFATTRWTVVLQAGAAGPERDEAMEIFCRTYWYPLYAFARRRGLSAEDASDAVQGFFAHMLAQGWLAGVERRETRFSTLLLTIFQRHLASEHRRATAEKRGGSVALLSIDLTQAEAWFGAEPATGETPERIYERRWALAVLDAALVRLREECREVGRSRHFDALASLLSREPADGEYDALEEKLRLTPGAVAVAVYRLRGQYRDFVRAEVAAGLYDPARVTEELQHLAAAL
jgi:RNA polymerase sigma-70 factor (ECF subfamily)